MKNYLSFMMLTTLFISSAHAFMSGIKPDLYGGAALEIIDGVIHKGPPNSPVSVGYGTFKNNTGKDIVLKHYTSPVYDKVEAHTMEYSSDGTAKMLQKESLTVPANGEIKSKSGGLHLMLMWKRRELVLDENIMIVTYDENEVRYMLNLKVIDPRSHNNHDHHMH